MAGRSTTVNLVKSADRTVDILELLASEPQGLTISDMSDRLSVARSSTHGLVHTLTSRGYLVQRQDRKFQLGARLIQLGLNVVDQLELRATAREYLEKLVESTQYTALLVLPDSGDFLFLDKVLSDSQGVRTDPRLTFRRPLHCSSLGKALLAALPDETVARELDLDRLESVTKFTITDRAVLLEDLARTRARGYSLDRQESVMGVFCVGAPLRDHTGRSIAAISLSTIGDFFDPDGTGPMVAEAAVDISRAMGWRGDLASLYLPVNGSAQQLFGTSPAAAEAGA